MPTTKPPTTNGSTPAAGSDTAPRWLDPATLVASCWRLRVLLPALLLLAGAAWWLGREWFVAREVTLEVLVVAAGSEPAPEARAEYAVEWRRSRDGIVNGSWLDAVAFEPDGGDAPRTVEFDAPNYRTDYYALRWVDPRVGNLRVERAMERTLLFGVPSRRASLAPLPDSVAIESLRFAGRPEVSAAGVVGSPALRAQDHVAGVAACYAALLALAGAVQAARRLARLAPNWLLLPESIALAAIVGVRAWVLWFTPMMMWSDSAHYLFNAHRLLTEGRFVLADFHFMVGYSVFLAPFIRLFDDFSLPLGIAQSAMGVGTAWMCRLMLRPVLPRPWPVVAMLLVGLDPDAIAYERWVLTETLSLFLVTLIGWLAVREVRRPVEGVRGSLAGLGRAVLLGLCCAAAIYARSALQTLLVLVPAMLIGARLPRLRPVHAAQGLVVALVALAALSPWMSLAKREHGRYGMALSYNFSRLQMAQMSGAIDANQTGVFSAADWERVRKRIDAGQMSPWTFANEVRSGDVFPKAEGQTWLNRREALHGEIVEESFARRPYARGRAVWIALTTQLGLWTKWEHERTNTTVETFTAPFRGHPHGASNIPDPSVNRNWAGTDLGPRMQRDIAYLRTSASARYFDEWATGWRLLRPFIGAFFLVGVAAAFFSREYGVFSLGMIVLGGVLAVSLIMLGAIERYRVVYTGLMGIVAVYGMATVARCARRNDDAQPGTPSAQPRP
ncbi:MAG: hypothetical protein DYG93_05040 [Leptolyngbya sp. PLA2]|nr:hypothetical protein [Leptolyngbya sp.]MCE7971012.1 hypothetical protein [Leptolyngbya sp. PL-A2]MCZ7631917.1 hypothetical protein [Phycisphaerales bacterium]MDL1905322.1 hypothetical protein [Synechococcales cyanobacterium CNB]GIK20278.1 MAG: hypothetical protein BroJett004_24420 [Planctomycetota bacterium]